MSRNGVTAIALAGVLGCSVGCSAFTPKAEYEAYREVRLADDLQARLRAMQRYVSAYPQGRWAPELDSARKAEDTRAFEQGKDSREGLLFYLDAFPDGAFAGQARTRLDAFAMIEQQRLAEAERAERAAEARRAREQEARRTWVGRFTRYWLNVLAGLSNWGAPVPEVAAANPSFSRAFGQAPRPRCTKDECVKYYTAQYAIPIPGATRLERSMQLILRLRMGAADGSLQRAELLLPGWGFSRWSEVERRALVVDSDPESRAEAVRWALSQLAPMVQGMGEGITIEKGYSLSPIERPAVGPTGEMTDTSATDPSAPGEHVRSTGVAPAERGVSDLLQPVEQPEEDLVVAPIVVGKDGQVLSSGAGEQGEGERAPEAGGASGGDGFSLDADSFREDAGGEAPAGAAGAGGEPDELVLDPIAVSEDGSGKAVITELPQTAQTPAEPVTQAYRMGDLRIVLFAAGGAAAAPAYDGVVIERVTKAGRSRAGKRKRSPAGR